MDAADRIARTIASEINASPAQVAAATGLLDGGATVPFVARYRKEVTGGLDDTQLRNLAERLAYLRELEARRAAILDSVKGQGKLTEDLARAIAGAETKATLEDIYLPYKPKRRTKGMIAREAGLEPLADRLFADPTLDPKLEAAAFINAEAGFADALAVLDGVRDLLEVGIEEGAGGLVIRNRSGKELPAKNEDNVITPAVMALLDGQLDALALVSAPESPIVRMLLITPGIRLFDFAQAEAPRLAEHPAEPRFEDYAFAW